MKPDLEDIHKAAELAAKIVEYPGPCVMGEDTPIAMARDFLADYFLRYSLSGIWGNPLPEETEKKIFNCCPECGKEVFVSEIKDGSAIIKCSMAACEFVASLTLGSTLVDALAEVEQKSPWQPIETAPKSDEFILVCIVTKEGVSNTRVATWGIGYPVDEDKFQIKQTEEDWICIYNEWVLEPTHWMPIPMPPINQKNKE